MISIIKASEKDYKYIVAIGKIAVREAHRESCTVAAMSEYLEKNYNDDSIKEEVNNQNNIYNIIYYNNTPVGFSKIILNNNHSNIITKNITKLDRIYLLKDFYGIKLGFELLKFNIDLAKQNSQAGMWLFTWVGNKRAVDFYLKTGFTIVGSHNFKVTETHYNLNHQMFLDFEKK